MKMRSWRKSVLVLLMVGMLLFSGSGCVPGFSGKDWEELGWKLLDAWLTQHEADPRTPGGAVNLAKRAASGSTGDADADAAIGIFKQFDSVKEGDKLMAEGQQLRAQGKLSEAADAMDDAIAERPQDWTYRVSRASLAFQNDDSRVAEREYDNGLDIIFDAGKQEKIRYHTETIDELESSVLDPSKMSPRTKSRYYDTLSKSYGDRGDLTGNQDDRRMAVRYASLGDEARVE